VGVSFSFSLFMNWQAGVRTSEFRRNESTSFALLQISNQF
jgi:hypothetical protein